MLPVVTTEGLLTMILNRDTAELCRLCFSSCHFVYFVTSW